jgi:hypothetical protein
LPKLIHNSFPQDKVAQKIRLLQKTAQRKQNCPKKTIAQRKQNCPKRTKLPKKIIAQRKPSPKENNRPKKTVAQRKQLPKKIIAQWVKIRPIWSPWSEERR